MNLRQFLKPNWRKIVLMILIPYFVIVFYDFYLISQGIQVAFLARPYYISTNNIYLLILVNGFVNSLLTTWWWSYSLGCLIVWIFNKVKKK